MRAVLISAAGFSILFWGTGRRSYLPLFLAALVPIVLFASVIAIIIGLRERDALEASAREKVREIAAGIDQFIAAQLKAAVVMAQVDSLQRGDLKGFYDFAARLKAEEPNWRTVVVLDPSGNQLINLTAPFGSSLPPVSGVASFEKILKEKKPTVGELVMRGSVSGKMFVPIRVPVLQGNDIKYIVTVDIDPIEISGLFKLADAPPDWVGAIVDRNGRLLGRSTRADQYVGQFATPVALEAIKKGDEGSYQGRTLEGLDTVFAFYTSSLTGWSVHYAVPQSEYRAPVRRMVGVVVLGGLLAAALAFLLAILMAREAAKESAREKERADALERSEARLRAVFETSYQFQALLTPEGVVLDANPISLAAIEAPIEAVVGKSFWETPWFSGTPALSEQIKTAIPLVAAGEVFRREIEVNLSTGRRAFDLALRPVVNPAGAVIAIAPSAMELTERRAAEEKLRQSQKMEAVGQLTGGIAHDFNNMLAIVIGNINLYKRRFARGEPELMRYLDGALDGADRAATLTRRLLAFSRQQPLSPQPIQANKLVGGLAELMRRTLGETIQFETVLAGGLWMTHADSGELENAVLNLAINGRDAMPNGGKLTIETNNAFLDEEYCRHNVGVAPGQYVLIAVTDTGAGMTPEVMEKAFEPFFTTKPTEHGTGLGLSQVFGFVRQSAGHVKLYSEIGVGTTVKIYLPRLHQHQDAVVVSNDPAIQPVQQGSRDEIIIVTEDDEQVRLVTTGALEELGYTVLPASNAAAALRHLELNPKACLLFTDIVMPEVNGRQLAEAALRRQPGPEGAVHHRLYQECRGA